METADQEFTGVFLSTAHPCKFPDVFPEEIKGDIQIPEQVKVLAAKEKHAIAMDVSFGSFKDYLLTSY
ncbi:threonine synthase [compost metagenome]